MRKNYFTSIILILIKYGGNIMQTTKLFKFGNSQSIRLPKRFQFNGDEVEIFKRGKEVIIRPISKDLSKAFYLLTKLPDDFFIEGRKDTVPQKRVIPDKSLK